MNGILFFSRPIKKIVYFFSNMLYINNPFVLKKES